MTLLSSLNQGANFAPTATTTVQGIDPLATLAQVQAATDGQRQITSYKLGQQIVGYYVAGRSYNQGQVVFLNGTAWQVVATSPTTQTPGASGATDWAPAEFTLPALPANTIISPSPIFGSGTLASPYIVSQQTIVPGSTNVQMVQVTISGMTPGAYVNLADMNDVVNGYRFTISNRYVNDLGVLLFNVVFNDVPTSAANTTFVCSLKVGNASVYIQLGALLNISAATQVISAPIITSPVNMSTGQSVNLAVSATAFAQGAGTPEAHLSSDWQIATDSAFSSVVRTSTNDAVNLLSWQPTPALPNTATLYSRVRYRGSLGTVSNWSTLVTFVTGSSVTIATPSVTSPVAGATGVVTSPTFTTSAFSVSAGADTHMNSDWQLATDALFTNVVQQTLANTTAKTSWSPSTALNASTVYYLRVRHRGNTGSVSAYSPVVSFTTSVPIGLSWTRQSVGITPFLLAGNQVTASAYLNNQYVILSGAGTTATPYQFYTSSDGQSYSTIGSPIVINAAFTSVAYGAGGGITGSEMCYVGGKYLYALEGYDGGNYWYRVMASSDLITWTILYNNPSNGTTQANMSGIRQAGNRVYWLSSYNGGTNLDMCSTADGSTIQTTTAPGAYIPDYAATDGTNVILSIFGGQRYFYANSNNGTTPFTLVTTAVARPKIAYYNGIWCTIQMTDITIGGIQAGQTSYATAVPSTDAVWTVVSPTGTLRPRTSSVVFDTGFVIPGLGFSIIGNQGVYTSGDGISWTYRLATNWATIGIGVLDHCYLLAQIAPTKIITLKGDGTSYIPFTSP